MNKENYEGLRKQLDNVNHPSHYTTGKIEVINFIEDSLQEGFEYYLVGNILKYMCRYKYKNGVEDLKKASIGKFRKRVYSRRVDKPETLKDTGFNRNANC